jgi:leucyl/phenylalanyl-tRNA--protein transferase
VGIMSARRTDILEIVSRYAAGYFPLYDEDGRFYWERLSVRAVIPVHDQTLARAKRLARRGKKRFEIRRTTAVDDVIEQLKSETVKADSWVREDVIAIYHALQKAGMLRTVEAWDPATGALVGALLGIALPGTFVAETMYGLVPEASKVCLCQLVEDCAASGIEMIDVQTPHDFEAFDLLSDELRTRQSTAHPCVRLGEQYLPLATFQIQFTMAWRRAFNGGIAEWIEKSRRP